MNQLMQGEFTGKTAEEAIREGLLTLGLKEEEAIVEVLEEGRKKLFGSVKARVRITKKQSDGERATDFLDGLFEILEMTATAELLSEGESIRINVTATNPQAVIGRRGEILDSLQSLAGAVANIGREDYRRVVVDCENYRKEREESLKKLALRLADKAVASAKKVRLDPMNPYERRIVHAVLAQNETVKTISEGKEPHRYIVIVPNNYDPEKDKKFRKPRKGDKRSDGEKKFNRDRREGREGRENREGREDRGKKPYRRDRRSSDVKKDVRKPAPFFGTYLGKNPNAGKEDEGSKKD